MVNRIKSVIAAQPLNYFSRLFDMLSSTRALLLGVCLSSLFGTVIIIITGWFNPWLVFEIIWYVTVVAVLTRSSDLVRGLSSLSIKQRATMTILASLCVFAQFTGGGGDLYPLTRWAMFSDPVSQPRAVVVQGIDAHGEVLSVVPEDFAGVLRNGRGRSLVGRLVSAAAGGNQDPLERTLSGMARHHEVFHSGTDLIEIRVVRLTMDSKDVLAASSIQSEVLWSMDLDDSEQ